MNRQEQLLELAESYLRESVASQSNAIDRNPEALRVALKGLGDRSLLALRVPQIRETPELSEETFPAFQEMVARYSGALAFLQTQHQSASNILANSDNESLKREYLPHLATGDRLVGVGFSQLRKGTPPVKALPVDGGYLIEGQVPWITGFSLFQEFIVAAVLPDDRALFGIMPFVATQQQAGGTLTFSEPMQLAAMQSTNTVTAQLTRWFLPCDRVVFVKPAGWIHENDKKNVLQHSFFALGCAAAGLDILADAVKLKQLPFISRAFESLDRELATCRDAIYQNLPLQRSPRSASNSPAISLQLRAWAIDLANRCAHAAVTVSSGAANYAHHAAQRVYREALVFTVSGQTTAVMEATLDRLIR